MHPLCNNWAIKKGLPALSSAAFALLMSACSLIQPTEKHPPTINNLVNTGAFNQESIPGSTLYIEGFRKEESPIDLKGYGKLDNYLTKSFSACYESAQIITKTEKSKCDGECFTIYYTADLNQKEKWEFEEEGYTDKDQNCYGHKRKMSLQLNIENANGVVVWGGQRAGSLANTHCNDAYYSNNKNILMAMIDQTFVNHLREKWYGSYPGAPTKIQVGSIILHDFFENLPVIEKPSLPNQDHNKAECFRFKGHNEGSHDQAFQVMDFLSEE